MRRTHDERLPDDLTEVAQLLDEHRPQATALELDQIKTRAMARARSPRPTKGIMKSRLLVAALTLGLMTGGTSVVIGHHKADHSQGGGAANDGYKPGKGCGDKNHEHQPKPGTGSAKKPCPPQAGGGGNSEQASAPAKKPKKN